MSENPSTQSLLDTIERKNAQLDVAYDSLANFTKLISHDLHSPVNTLRELLGILHEQHLSQLDDEGQQLLEMVKLSADRTHQLTKGLTRYSRDCRPAALAEPIDVAALANEWIENNEEKLTAQNVNVTVNVTINDMPSMMGNPEALNTMLSHLLDNALTFQPNDGQQRTVSVTAERDEHCVHIKVQDQGLGIDKKQATQLFKPLPRIANRAEYPGAGLGLSLCAIIAQSLDGNVWMTPNSSGGCTFHLQLPVADNTPRD